VDCGHQARAISARSAGSKKPSSRAIGWVRPAARSGAGFGQIEQREAVGDFAEGLERPVEAVAVGVGLDHREGLAWPARFLARR
jgi:hypothetical protein